MNIKVFSIFSLILLIYAGSNYFIGVKGWHFCKSIFPAIHQKIYWPVFAFFPISFILGMVSYRITGKKVFIFIELIGYYWIFVIFYFLILFLTFKIWGLLFGSFGFIADLKNNAKLVGTIFLSILFSIFLYGSINARIPIISEYFVSLNKSSKSINKLNVVMISDLHIGNIINNNQLKKYVDKVNTLSPDIIFIAGDLIDSNIDVVVKNNMHLILKELKSKYGTYACLGNHEHISKDGSKIIDFFKASNITLLIDTYTLVKDSFYVVGRNDLSSSMFGADTRKDLNEVMKGIDKTLPIILLDHQPRSFKESVDNGIDLQFSGHTHKGQLFPISYITAAIHELDYGYKRIADFNVIVSSGLGTWGPPVRVGNNSEIVQVELKFKE